VLSFILFSTAVVFATFEGTFTESYYGDNEMDCCIRNTNVLYCSYADLGIISGTISGNKATGSWYEGGGDVVTCSRGTFSWTLKEDNSGFTGTYFCVNDPTEYDWNEERLSSNVPTSEECAVRRSDEDISGTAVRYVLCNSGGEYSLSYDYDSYSTVIFGYEDGVTFESNSIGSGYYYEDNGRAGASLVFVLENGDQGSFYRDTEEYGVIAPFDLSSEPPFLYGGFFVSSDFSRSNPSPNLCEANIDIKDEYLATVYTSENSSGSSSSNKSSGSSSSNNSSSSCSSHLIYCYLPLVLAIFFIFF